MLSADAANLNLIGREVFAAMKPRAYFINVGRGETVDEAALIEALAQRRIAGAGLDVFATEPLPAASPLWKMPQVFMAPHVGGLFEEYAADGDTPDHPQHACLSVRPNRRDDQQDRPFAPRNGGDPAMSKTDPASRILTRISDAELARRWSAVRRSCSTAASTPS